MRNIIIAGFGPHARRIYYRFLEKHQKQYDIRIPLIIELSDQKAVVEKFLEGKPMQPDKIIYLPVTSLPHVVIDSYQYDEDGVFEIAKRYL